MWIGFCFGQSCARAASDSKQRQRAERRVDSRRGVLARMLPSRAREHPFRQRNGEGGVWLPLLEQALPHDRFSTSPDEPIDIAARRDAARRHARSSSNGVKLIQSLWMGVEKLLADPGLPEGVPIARLIDPGMVAAMSETVLAHVLDWHRHHYRYRAQQRRAPVAPAQAVPRLRPHRRHARPGRRSAATRRASCSRSASTSPAGARAAEAARGRAVLHRARAHVAARPMRWSACCH